MSKSGAAATPAYLRGIFIFMEEYKHDHYGKERILTKGQKVIAIYYHEYDNEGLKAYKRPFYQTILDKPFKPVKCGVIVGNAGNHPYWLSFGKNEQYLFVKFPEYRYAKAIPISCLQDAKEYAENTMSFLKMSEPMLGQKGFSYESYGSLIATVKMAENF